jgi:hypothetical protein
MMHLVNRLRFEFGCANEGQAFSFREGFVQTYQLEITSIIDEICSKYVADDEFLQIDQLEIDLGRFGSPTLGHDFADIFRFQFEKQLLLKLQEQSSLQRQRLKHNSQLELFCHFMLQGSLPWWAIGSELNIDNIALALRNDFPEQLQAFFYWQHGNQSLWLRAAFQLNDTSKLAILSLFKDLQVADVSIQAWIASSAMVGKIGDSALMITEQIHNSLLIHAPQILENPDSQLVLAKVLETVLNKIAPDWSDSQLQDSLNDFTSLNVQQRHALHQNESNISKAGWPEELQVYTDLAIEAEPRYIVYHAGVVVLAPFLKPFFIACGLLDGLEWKDKASQYQAVHLLKYLASGGLITPEHSLLLEKLICGLPIDEPIPVDAGLEAAQLEESQKLLASVISHWQVLKNTSIEGFRETFLKRDGLITCKQDGWMLQVERKTLDVLLDSIPWGYSTLVLPWNQYIINVEW